MALDPALVGSLVRVRDAAEWKRIHIRYTAGVVVAEWANESRKRLKLSVTGPTARSHVQDWLELCRSHFASTKQLSATDSETLIVEVVVR